MRYSTQKRVQKNVASGKAVEVRAALNRKMGLSVENGLSIVSPRFIFRSQFGGGGGITCCLYVYMNTSSSLSTKSLRWMFWRTWLHRGLQTKLQRNSLYIKITGRNFPPTDVFPFPLTLKSYSSEGNCIAIQYYHPRAKRLPRAWCNLLLFLQAWCSSSNMHLKLKAVWMHKIRKPETFSSFVSLCGASVSAFWSCFCIRAIAMLMSDTLLHLSR